MAVDRHRNPPVTPYQHARRHWLDTVSAITARATTEANPHTRAAWFPLSIALTAACPRKGQQWEQADAEKTALALVSEHQKRCDCRDDDWTWLTNSKQEEA